MGLVGLCVCIYIPVCPSTPRIGLSQLEFSRILTGCIMGRSPGAVVGAKKKKRRR